jgi:hypothetical protein
LPVADEGPDLVRDLLVEPAGVGGFGGRLHGIDGTVKRMWSCQFDISKRLLSAYSPVLPLGKPEKGFFW